MRIMASLAYPENTQRSWIHSFLTSLQLLFHCHNFCILVRQKWCKAGRGILSRAYTACVDPFITATIYCLAYVWVHRKKMVKDPSVPRPSMADIKTHSGAQKWFLTSLLVSSLVIQTLEMWPTCEMWTIWDVNPAVAGYPLPQISYRWHS